MRWLSRQRKLVEEACSVITGLAIWLGGKCARKRGKSSNRITHFVGEKKYLWTREEYQCPNWGKNKSPIVKRTITRKSMWGTVARWPTHLAHARSPGGQKPHVDVFPTTRAVVWRCGDQFWLGTEPIERTTWSGIERHSRPRPWSSERQGTTIQRI